MNTRRSRRKIHPKGHRNSNTVNEMITGGSITIADARLRTTRKPTKTPTDKTTALSTGRRNKEDGIDANKRTAATNQHLRGSRKEGIKSVLAV